jgi:hypothetical protein
VEHLEAALQLVLVEGAERALVAEGDVLDMLLAFGGLCRAGQRDRRGQKGGDDAGPDHRLSPRLSGHSAATPPDFGG